VSNSLYGLAHMHAEWGALSTSVQGALLLEVGKSLPTVSESQLSSMLSSLAKLGAKWEMIPPPTQLHLFTTLSELIPSMSEQHISNILFALGSMGLAWYELPSTLTRALTHGLLRVNAGRGRSHTIRATTDFEPDAPTRTAIESITYLGNKANKARRSKYLSLTPPTHTPKSAPMLSMHTPRSPHTPTQRSAVSELLSEYDSEEFELFEGNKNSNRNSDRNSDREPTGTTYTPTPVGPKKLNAQGLSMSIMGLSRLGAVWAMLPSSLVSMLESSLLALLPQMNSVQISSTLAGLGKMKWRWDNLAEQLKRQIGN
jgi:hypothetical protein